MATQLEQGLTCERFEALVFDDDLRRELIDGRIVVNAAPLRPHQQVASRLHVRLAVWGEPRGVEVLQAPGVRAAEDSEPVPDVVAILPETVARLSVERVDLAPELVVEVSSPSTRRLDLGRKREVYEAAGVATYWFVDLDAETVLVHRLGEDGHYDEPVTVRRGDDLAWDVLDGFAVAVDDVLGAPRR